MSSGCDSHRRSGWGLTNLWKSDRQPAEPYAVLKFRQLACKFNKPTQIALYLLQKQLCTHSLCLGVRGQAHMVLYNFTAFHEILNTHITSFYKHIIRLFLLKHIVCHIHFQGSFQLFIAVMDSDDNFLGSLIGGDEYVDSIFIKRSLQPNGSFSAPQSYRGTYQRGTISLSFRVSCTENFYGPNCATFCEPNDNYTCGTNGSIVCRPNHYGSQCATICKPTNRYQCDESGRRICHQNYYSPPECQTFCTPTGQYTCTTNGERRCRRNYYNLPNCTTFCMPRDDSQGHYTCSEDGRIRCLPGYYGPQCTIFCEPQVGQFDCNNSTGERLCAEGYYGTLCNVFCEGRNDSLGHYQCGQNGSKICLEGYQDPDTNCTTRKWVH